MTVVVEVVGTGLEEVEEAETVDFQMIGFPMVVEEVVVATGVERDGEFSHSAPSGSIAA